MKQDDNASTGRRSFLRRLGALGLSSKVGELAMGLSMSAQDTEAAAVPAAAMPPLRAWILNWADHVEIWRQITQGWSQLGISVETQQGTIDTWVTQIIGQHKMPHFAMMAFGGSPDRMDPDYFISELFHSRRAVNGGLNYGHYKNARYDQLADAQRQEMDDKKRQKLVWESQEVLAADSPSLILIHRDYLQAYNVSRWDGVVAAMGSGIAMPHAPWSYLKMKPKTNRRVVRVSQGYDINTLNPFATPEIQNYSKLRWIYPTFVTRDEKTEIIPWAAESWKVVNPTTVDVTIREGMKFHDGKPVTVEDAKFTFDFILQWKFPALSRVVDSVTEAEITSPRVLRLKLKQPHAPFVPNVLGFAFIAPKHIWEKVPQLAGLKTPADWPNDQPVGSGPFKFGEWKKGEYLFLVANKDHWFAPNIDGVYWLVIPSTDNQLGVMERGDADMLAATLDAKKAEQLAAHKDLKAVGAANTGMHEVRMNLDISPTNDLPLRRALQHATNRKQLLDIVYGGAGTVANNTFISPILKSWSNPKLVTPEYSIDKARGILKGAGYSWDKAGRLVLPPRQA